MEEVVDEAEAGLEVEVGWNKGWAGSCTDDDGIVDGVGECFLIEDVVGEHGNFWLEFVASELTTLA